MLNKGEYRMRLQHKILDDLFENHSRSTVYSDCVVALAIYHVTSKPCDHSLHCILLRLDAGKHTGTLADASHVICMRFVCYSYTKYIWVKHRHSYSLEAVVLLRTYLDGAGRARSLRPVV